MLFSIGGIRNSSAATSLECQKKGKFLRNVHPFLDPEDASSRQSATSKDELFLLISLEFLGGPFPGHLRWDYTCQGKCESSPSQVALSTCPCPCTVIRHPSLPLSVSLVLFIISLLISNPCLPSVLTKNHAQGTACPLPLLGDSTASAIHVLPGAGSTVTPTSTFSKTTLTSGLFLREILNSFTALGRNVVPGHNLVLLALPTFPLAHLFLGGTEESGSLGVMFSLWGCALTWAGRV